jgi:hypothetical protein
MAIRLALGEAKRLVWQKCTARPKLAANKQNSRNLLENY